MDFYDFLGALYVAVVAGVIGCGVGYRIGHRIGILSQRTASLRRRRPLQINVDWDFAERCFNNSGYKIVRDDRKLH